VPDVKGQTEDSARQILTASGFQNVVSVPTDSAAPCNQVIGTVPTGQEAPVDTPIQLQLSRCNQFVMPDVRGGFWTDVEPNLRAGYGWTGQLIRAPDVQNSGQKTNAVVTQSPSPGTAINKDAPITLAFAS
jgi:serine/threonine-protein kinase